MGVGEARAGEEEVDGVEEAVGGAARRGQELALRRVGHEVGQDEQCDQPLHPPRMVRAARAQPHAVQDAGAPPLGDGGRLDRLFYSVHPQGSLLLRWHAEVVRAAAVVSLFRCLDLLG